MAIRRVELLLRKVTAALERAKIPYAVVGGNAVAAWVATVDEGAVRFTKDVDVLVQRDDLQAISAALAKVNLIPAEVLGVTMFVDRRRPNPRTGVHIIFAGERIRPEYVHPAPTVGASVRGQSGYRVIKLPELLAMKLQAFRDIDRVHIADMLSVGLIDAGVRKGLPEELVARLGQLE